eukprot:scaffold70724_cov29-Tisochrysis_lutea.AAC.2
MMTSEFVNPNREMGPALRIDLATPSRVRSTSVGAATCCAKESWHSLCMYSGVGSKSHGSVDQLYPPPGASRTPRLARSRAESTVK